LVHLDKLIIIFLIIAILQSTFIYLALPKTAIFPTLNITFSTLSTLDLALNSTKLSIARDKTD
jgi:hypothetical protein